MGCSKTGKSRQNRETRVSKNTRNLIPPLFPFFFVAIMLRTSAGNIAAKNRDRPQDRTSLARFLRTSQRSRSQI